MILKSYDDILITDRNVKEPNSVVTFQDLDNISTVDVAIASTIDQEEITCIEKIGSENSDIYLVEMTDNASQFISPGSSKNCFKLSLDNEIDFYMKKTYGNNATSNTHYTMSAWSIGEDSPIIMRYIAYRRNNTIRYKTSRGELVPSFPSSPSNRGERGSCIVSTKEDTLFTYNNRGTVISDRTNESGSEYLSKDDRELLPLILLQITKNYLSEPKRYEIGIQFNDLNDIRKFVLTARRLA